MSVTARQTRLYCVSDLSGFRTTLVDLLRGRPPADVGATFVLVPSRAAGEQLRRTLEDAAMDRPGAARLIPAMGPREDWYHSLAARLTPSPRMLTGFEREVMVAAAAREAEQAGTPPPFRVRPGLIAEMVALYDHIHRLGRSIDDFERNFRLELEKGVENDRGAERLLRQTAFLVATFRGYASRVARSAGLDESALRTRLLSEASSWPLAHLIVGLADRLADSDGLWPADFDLLSRLDGLLTIDIVSTEATLASGFAERLRAALPGFDEVPGGGGAARRLPTFEMPRSGIDARGELSFVSRDREEELAMVARRLKAASAREDAPSLDRVALVVRRPLPYLYLAREVFGSAGIPFETLDTLPLAAEPYAAAVDLALNAVISDFSRRSLIALLRAPQFRFEDLDHPAFSPHRSVVAGLQPRAVEAQDHPSAVAVQGIPAATVLRASIAALDAALAEARYQGGLERLDILRQEWSAIDPPARREERRRTKALPAMSVALEAARRLAAVGTSPLVVDQIDALLAFLRRFDRPMPDVGASAEPSDALTARSRRVHAAVLGAITALGEAYRRHDPEAEGDIVALAAAVRRWLGARTFALRTGAPGLQILDAQAAKYGVFDDVQIMGVINGEWPEPTGRSVLYPASMMGLLEPGPATPHDTARRARDTIEGARAAFRDLLTLARSRVRVSSFLLENDAVVEPSGLLDEIPRVGLPTGYASEIVPARIFLHEAVATDPRAPEILPPAAARWARARLEPRPDAGRFRGMAGPWVLPRVSVSRLERYLDCPFRFFSSEVLRLEEEPEDEDARTPLERGRFLHELFEGFFSEWQRRGHGRITPDTLPAARALFEERCDEALRALPPVEAALERTRLLGSAVSAGIAHRVLAMEAERGVDVVERLLEFPLQGDFTFHGTDGRTRTVTLSGVTDRIDLLADGSMRVIDYKSKLTPDVKQALQLPIYSVCTRERVQGRHKRAWQLAEALYLSFEGERAVVPLRVRGRTLEELVAAAEDRLLTTLDAIAAGTFPPQPVRKSLCAVCPYSAVCRLEWVEPEDG